MDQAACIVVAVAMDYCLVAVEFLHTTGRGLKTPVWHS